MCDVFYAEMEWRISGFGLVYSSRAPLCEIALHADLGYFLDNHQVLQRAREMKLKEKTNSPMFITLTLLTLCYSISISGVEYQNTGSG